jgi:hypothetical protein
LFCGFGIFDYTVANTYPCGGNFFYFTNLVL